MAQSMSTGLIAMLLGLFIVPAFLLYLGHRLRRRSRRSRGTFWGALSGHTAGALLATVYSMIPPEEWRPEDATRGFFGFYAMLLFALIGALIGYLLASRRPG
jgi:hypothetical protein